MDVKKQTKPEQESRYSKEQLLKAAKYQNRKDVLNTILIDGERYTLEAVERLLHEFMKGTVK